MSNNNIVENNEKTMQKGDYFEGLVKKVYRCYYLLNAKKNNFFIKQKYKVEDLKNADYYFSKEKNNKKELDNIKNTELADVYFSYTDDENKKIETYIECKSGNFQKKEIEKQCVKKLDKFGIKNVNKIVAFQCEKKLKDEVKEFCQKNNIELVNINELIKGIDLTIQILPNYCLTNVKPLFDKKWCTNNNINIPNDKALNLFIKGLIIKGIKINDKEHIFHGESDGVFLNWLRNNGFKESIIEVKKTISYSRNEENDRLYIIVDSYNDDTINNLHKIKVNKLELCFSIINHPPFRQLIEVDNDDSFAKIENIYGKKEIVFESGKIEEV